VRPHASESILNALYLQNELPCQTTLQDYERIAVELARNPEKLTEIKRKLDERRQTTPLFDTNQFTRHIEAACITMYEHEQAGLPPDHISISN